MVNDSTGTVGRLPTVEEILAGDTQAGVAKPGFLIDDENDGSVQRVGSTPVPIEESAETVRPSRCRRFWARVLAAFRMEKAR